MVLVGGTSKRSITQDYRIGSEALKKILANADPLGYRQKVSRPKPVLGQFLGVIEDILIADRDAPAKQRHTAKRIFERLRDEHGYVGCSSQARAQVAAVYGADEPLTVGLINAWYSSHRPQTASMDASGSFGSVVADVNVFLPLGMNECQLAALVAMATDTIANCHSWLAEQRLI